jgi:predicted ATP-grasp superfamily ATP-dependent carboligase
LAPAIAFLPDPEGAAILVDTLNHVYDLNVETHMLLKKAEEIKQKFNEVTKRHQRIRKAEEKIEGSEEYYIV